MTDLSATCVIEVGHPAGTPATWRDELSELTVCDHHRNQYDTSDEGPFSWVRA